MLSARSVFEEILDNDDTYQLFCSIVACDEAQGGWENGRIAALVPESFAALSPKIARHGADEDKHGRIFKALLKKRGLPPVPVPDEVDYTMRLERLGIGVAHRKLNAGERLGEEDIIDYLTHSRVTEQRAADQMRALRRYVGARRDLGPALRTISADEDAHLAYCHEELLRLSAEGHGRAIRRALHDAARAEIRVHREVSKAVMARMAKLLGWHAGKSAVLAAGIELRYRYERLVGWRRMVSLEMPAQRDALGHRPGAPAAGRSSTRAARPRVPGGAFTSLS